MTAVFFDESGYTGRNLLDPAQPLFVIASSRIDEGDAARILSDAFPRFKGEEFKFADVWKRYRQRLVPFCAALGERASDLYRWQVDKKFCVLQKMIDFLVEPIAYQAGLDFYRNAHAYKYSNLIYSVLNHICSPELYDATVAAYFEFARDPNEASLNRLRFRLQLFATSCSDEIRSFFDTALLGALSFHEHSSIETFKDTMEIYVTSMLSCVSHWAQDTTEDLDLRHDQSNGFFAQKELWDILTSKDVEEQWHPVANGPPIRFPLPVRATNSLDSKSSAAIQLCDLLAGLTAKIQNRPEGEGQDAIDRILETGFVDVPINGLNPGLEFPEGGPEPRDGPDPVDLMVGIVRGGMGKPSGKKSCWRRPC
jgi:hypothetical protein